MCNLVLIIFLSLFTIQLEAQVVDGYITVVNTSGAVVPAPNSNGGSISIIKYNSDFTESILFEAPEGFITSNPQFGVDKDGNTPSCV